jgi:hypothetical protein
LLGLLLYLTERIGWCKYILYRRQKKLHMMFYGFISLRKSLLLAGYSMLRRFWLTGFPFSLTNYSLSWYAFKCSYMLRVCACAHTYKYKVSIGFYYHIMIVGNRRKTSSNHVARANHSQLYGQSSEHYSASCTSKFNLIKYIYIYIYIYIWILITELRSWKYVEQAAGPILCFMDGKSQTKLSSWS